MPIETLPPPSQAERDGRLLAGVRSRRESALAEITTRFGRELTGVAYLVLRHHGAATRAAAIGIAELWGRQGDAGIPPDVERLRVALLGATARHALRLHATSRTVDPDAGGGLTGLSPQARAAVALHHLAGLGAPTVAALLELSPARLRRLLQADPTAERIRALAGQLASLPVTLDAAAVRAALAEPPDTPPATRRRWVGVAMIPLALVLLWVATQPTARLAGGLLPRPASAAVTNANHPDLGSDSPWSRSWPGRTGVPAFTLADCGIEPASMPIEFAGWVTVEEIGASGVAPAGRSVFALVPRRGAGLLALRAALDAPDMARPVGRLACVFDPDSGAYVPVRVTEQWRAPTLADGCPVSPIGSFAGYRELGGPGAFVLVDAQRAWTAQDPGISFLARLTPAPPAGAAVDAWLQPVGDGAPIKASLDNPPDGLNATRSITSYFVVDGIEIPEPGCWVMNIAVGGRVVGSAVLPIVAHSEQPVP